MDRLSIDEFKGLISEHEKPCISIYMPTIRAGDQVQQNPIRFKNLIRQAERELREKFEFSSHQVDDLLSPAYNETLNNEVFWQQQRDGLAFFLSPDTFRQYRLPLDFQELAVVANEFHLKPLLGLFANNGKFFILAISQDEVRLLEGTRFSVDEIELEGVPTSLQEALRFDDPEKQLQLHVSTGPTTGGRRRFAVYHGHGAGTEGSEEKVNILRYFHKVDEGLKEILSDENAPLILAGVEYLFPIYKEANSYNNLVDEGITGNPEGLSAKELHEQAWEILQPRFKEDQSKAFELFKQQSGMQTGRASNDLNEILSAAFQGRVGQLFIQAGQEKWGTYDLLTGQTTVESGPTGENQDILEIAALQTILNKGEVYIVEPHELPASGPIAAVFRY